MADLFLMRALFITNGSIPQPSPRTFIKSHLPNLADRAKNTAALMLPAGLLRKLLKGFSLEKRFPIGLGYLSAVLKRDGVEVDLLDRFVQPDSWIPRAVSDYDFIGIHASTPYFQDALDVLDRLDREGYDGPIAIGGPHATLSPSTVPPRVNYLVQGEAEYIITDLVHGKFASGSLIRTPRIRDIDVLPRVDYELFMHARHAYDVTAPYAPQSPFFNMHTSRSCPFACTFCAVKDVWGKLWVAHSADRVVDDMAFLKSNYGATGIYFREDYFATQRERVAAICEQIIRFNLDIVWACETRVDIARYPDLIALMARAGCRGFYIGAESGSDRMLAKYRKEATSADIRNLCGLAHKHQIKVAMCIIVADPDESITDRVSTWRMVRDCRPHALHLSAYYGDQVGLNPLPYPVHAPRPVVMASPPNGTWAGQADRRKPALEPATS